MHRFLLLSVLVAVALLGGAGMAAANTPENQSQPNVTETSEISGDPIDDDLTLREWSYSSGTFLLTFENDADRPKIATITEATQPGEGAQRYSISQERLSPGESTVSFSSRSHSGEAAASITTADSIASGHGLTISTGSQGGDDPFAPFGGTSGVFSGVGLSIIMSGSAAGWVLWREEKGVITA